MERSLLIIGCGAYSLVAYEIACDMNEFKQIAFIDDAKTKAPTGAEVLGKTSELGELSKHYSDCIVAFGEPSARMRMLDKIKNETTLNIPSLISSKAYVSPSAEIEEGVIIEPFAVVHSSCKIKRGCFISAGAVVNHESVCMECVHVDCNATVPGYMTVPPLKKVSCGEVFRA